MSNSIHTIPYLNLAIACIPAAFVIGILIKWSHDYRDKLYALSRMLIQLLLIGYVLTYIFESDNPWFVLLVLILMLGVSSWISLRSLKIPRKTLLAQTTLSISIGGGITLALITQGVLEITPWYSPSTLIPLAGMIFASSMNALSLAGERFESEIERGADYYQARNIALKASLIPITNSLFAVGLVLIPGVMTGQILSGVSPLIAARYQIMVMFMTFGASGLSSALFLIMVKSNTQLFLKNKQSG